MEALRPHLGEGQCSVGTAINLTHTGASLPGMTVRYEVEVVEVEGINVTWKVDVFDDLGPIGSGTHSRAVLDESRFRAGVERRAAKAGVPGLGA